MLGALPYSIRGAAMAGRRRDFSRALLIRIAYAAGYHGGGTHSIAARLGISVRTWHRWKSRAEVKNAIAQGVKRRWNRSVIELGWNPVELEAELDAAAAALDALDRDFYIETYTESGYFVTVETMKTGNGITRTISKTPVLQPIEELLKPENL
jgi:transposase-like protein